MYLMTAHIKTIQRLSEARSATPDAPVVPHDEPQPHVRSVRTALTGRWRTGSRAVAVH